MDGDAVLDTGNSAPTMISRVFAERLDLVDNHGVPRMMGRSAKCMKIRGVVAEAEVWVVPAVTFEIKGLQLTSDMVVGVGENESQDVLVSVHDIRKFKMEGGDFNA